MEDKLFSVDKQIKRLPAFPKELNYQVWQALDKRYFSILAISMLFFFSLTFYGATRDWQINAEIQQAINERAWDNISRIIEFNSEKDDPEKTDPSGENNLVAETDQVTDVSDDETMPQETSQVEKQQDRERRRQDAAAYAEDLRQDINASNPLLVLAADRSGSGTGLAVYDLLNDPDARSGGVADMQKVIENSSRLQTEGRPGKTGRVAKGSISRDAEGDKSIDDLIVQSSLQTEKTIQRRGVLAMEKDDLTVRGDIGKGRDAESLTEKIKRHSSSVEYCYQRAARVNPNLSGRFEIEITIAASGAVQRARVVESTLDDRRLTQCLLRTVKRWQFGAVAGTGNTVVRVPFIF